MSSALTRAELPGVVTDKNRPHDAVIRLSADVTSVPSIFVVKVDGRVLKDAVARVRMAIEANGIRVDEVEATTAGGKPTERRARPGGGPEAVWALAIGSLRAPEQQGPRGRRHGPAGRSAENRDRRAGQGDTLVVVNVEAPSMPSAQAAGSPPRRTASRSPRPGRPRPPLTSARGQLAVQRLAADDIA
ncbi:MAG: hypothetical protein U0359_03405 [Byssovorax sp.]